MKYGLSLALLLAIQSLTAQTDAEMLDRIHKTALTQGHCYQWLDDLSNKVGARLSGSEGAAKGVKYTQEQLNQLGLDKVYLQEVLVPKWERGEKEVAYLNLGKKRLDLSICALGMSVATPKNGLEAQAIEVKSLDELKALGADKVKGKIIFFNRPMDPEQIETFRAYGGCVDQRSSGAREAGKLGAVGVIVRSMNLRLDDLPHTGMTNYGDTPENQRIPAAAVSTLDANALSEALKSNPNATLFFRQSCVNKGEVLSYNVIGEITGTEYPNQIMVVGGHLDSWDLGDGSHDDGAGCVQSMEVLELFKKIGYKPKHTIRAVLFMNEENGVKGGLQYEAEAQRKGEHHIFALESDAGGFAPRGFSFEIDDANFGQVGLWKPLFEPYLIHLFRKGHSGVDIGPLKSPKIVKAGLQPDSQRYFDHHHAANDTFDAVNKRELELGAAAMTSLIYLFDKYGIL
ncbi:M28 family peptidase [Flavobacterium sp. N1719]|uniref:M28 family peptidase n=1 Tax=Flavobacterium sp. N1719 TaxID=2885633 RepID=UPI0022231569|nr:M28 family peptidase [Flavobacterium sp. N1719]